MAKAKSSPPAVCVNRKARHEYEILDRVEAGLVLRGSEVKALREGKGNLVDAYVRIDQGRPWLIKLEISPYSHDHSGSELAPRRPRALLLKAREIQRLRARVDEKGLTLVPLSIYFKGPWAKVEVGVGRGRRRHDKREILKRRDAQREMDRARGARR